MEDIIFGIFIILLVSPFWCGPIIGLLAALAEVIKSFRCKK